MRSATCVFARGCFTLPATRAISSPFAPTTIVKIYIASSYGLAGYLRKRAPNNAAGLVLNQRQQLHDLILVLNLHLAIEEALAIGNNFRNPPPTIANVIGIFDLNQLNVDVFDRISMLHSPYCPSLLA